jgi:hypothetical protein
VDATIALIRFLFGAVIGVVFVACLAIWNLMPLWLGLVLPPTVGGLAVVFGDRFLVGFMRVFRWLR